MYKINCPIVSDSQVTFEDETPERPPPPPPMRTQSLHTIKTMKDCGNNVNTSVLENTNLKGPLALYFLNQKNIHTGSGRLIQEELFSEKGQVIS